MKAVIMAGGEGSRLRPLTCDRPKPLVPVCNRPVLAYIVDLLRGHGFSQVHLTLGYLAAQVQETSGDWLGSGGSGRPPGRPAVLSAADVHFWVEREPLGTAGSVAALRPHLDGTFAVLSGDALTDLDLGRLLSFHRRTGAMVTLALHKVANPLEYGVVLTAPGGRILRFLEKPGWGEVFSDTVNTGIYMVEPEALAWVPPGRPFDFSRDLFPQLLAAGAPLYGWVAPGYWCDIGDLGAYRQANMDLLQGRLAFRPPGRPVAPGLWLEAGAEIAEGVEIRGPALLGAGCQVGRGARLAEGVVLGAGTLVEPHASVKRSVVWQNVRVGGRAALRGAIAADAARLDPGASAYEGAVLGPGATLAEGATLRPGVKLWPGKRVRAGATAAASVVWGGAEDAGAPARGRLEGGFGTEVLAEQVLRTATALGTVLAPGPVILGADAGRPPALLRQALAAGLAAAGRAVRDVGATVWPVTGWAVAHAGAAGGAHVRWDGAGRVAVVLLDERALPLGRDRRRRLEQALAREDFPRAPAAGTGAQAPFLRAESLYLEELAATLDLPAVRARRFRLDIRHPVGGWGALDRLARNLGASLGAPGEPAEVVGGIDPLQGGWWLAGGDGRPLPEEAMLALDLLLALRARRPETAPDHRQEQVEIPVTAPRALEELCARYGRRPRRVPLSDYHPGDPLLALGRLLEFMAREGLDQAGVLGALPPMPVSRLAVPCPWELRARVMRRLLEEHGEQVEEMLDGLRLKGPGGVALVLPDPEEPLYRVYGEGETAEDAAAVARYFGERVACLADEGR